MAQLASCNERILKALDDPKTCTREILLDVKNLLSPSITETDAKSAKENVRGVGGHARAKSVVTTTKVTAKAVSRTKGHARQLTVVEVQQKVVLSQQEKVNFAFYVVNSCIKNLARLAKEHVLAKRTGVASANDTKTKTNSKVVPAETALRSKSPNARRFAAIDEVCSTTPDTSSAPAAIATCASTALAFLRSHYQVSEHKDSTFQVENGTLAVAGKCLDLELQDIALEQVRALKSRLLEHIGERTVLKPMKIVDIRDFGALLHFPESIKDSPVLTFAMKLQQLLWQLLPSHSNVKLIEEIADTPASAAVSCTLSLLRHSSGLPDQQTKIDRQYAAFSRILLQLSAIAGLSPTAMLVLRCSGFSVQMEKLTADNQLSEHEAKDIAVKLGRCLYSFFKTSTALPDTKYDIAKRSADPLLDRLKTNPSCEAELQPVRQILGQLAAQAGHAAEAKKVSSISARTKTSKIDAIRLAASGMLSDKGTELLQMALIAIRQPGELDKENLDRLLVEVVGLRRAIHKAVSEKSKIGRDCLDAANACLDFLGSYLGVNGTSDGDHHRATSESDERKRLGRRFVKPFISTVIVCCMHVKEADQELLSALDCCCNLFSSLVARDETFANERFNDQQEPESSIFVTISRLSQRIWNHRLSTHGSTDAVTIAALATSIKAIGPWSTREKELVGYAEKLYYLVSAHIACSKWLESRLIFQKLISEYRAAGYLAQLGEQAATVSSLQLREKGSVGSLLFRSLRSSITIMLKSDLNAEEVIYTDLDVAPAARGLLLEWQLEQLTQYASQQRTPDKDCSKLIQATLNGLLSIYDMKNHPIRRLRVVNTGARLLPRFPELRHLDELLQDYPSQPSSKTHGKDAGLKDQYPSLLAMLRSSIALTEPHGDNTLETLKSSVGTWQDIVSSIRSVEDVNRHIHDVAAWCEHLEAIADLFALQGETHMETQAIETLVSMVIMMPDQIMLRSRSFCRLAEAYIQLGHTGKANHILQLAMNVFKDGSACLTSQVRLQLATAEYHLAVGKIDAGRNTLAAAAVLAAKEDENSVLHRAFSASTTALNVYERRLVARAAFLSSSLELEEGRPASAMRMVSIAKCMLFKIWSSMEQLMPREHVEDVRNSASMSLGSDEDSTMEDVQPIVIRRSYSHLTSSQLRMLVPDLVRVAMLEVRIHNFRGAYHEAFAALRHANKIANYVGGGTAVLCDSAAADLYIRSLPLNSLSTRETKIKEARSRIDMVDEYYIGTSSRTDVLTFSMAKAKVLAAEEEPEEQLDVLRGMLEQLKKLFPDETPSCLSRIEASLTTGADELVDQLSELKLDKQGKPTKSSKAEPAAKKVTKKTKPAKGSGSTAKSEADRDDLECVSLSGWHGTILRETALAALTYHTDSDFVALTKLVEKAGSMLHRSTTAVAQSTALARILFAQATEQMSADITYNALHESIVTVPTPQLLVGLNAPQAQAAPAKTPRKGKTTKAKSSEASQPPTCSSSGFKSVLENAQNALSKDLSTTLDASTVGGFREHSRLQATISLTTSACGASSSLEVLQPISCAHHIDAPGIRTHVLNRSVEHPGVEKLSREDLRAWPSIVEPTVPGDTVPLHQDTFQADYVDIIPEAWNVVSLSLTEDRTAMVLVRYRCGQSPFIVRVPFAHRESDDPDQEVLDMSLAYEQLRQIIKQHEFNAVEAGVTDKPEFKRKWWERKRELDGELQLLLNDVEDQWFTAVKGVFSSQCYDDQALSDFKTEVQSVIVQACPAKKGRGKGKAPALSLNLDKRFLELFVGLGDPSGMVEVETEEGVMTELRTNTTAMTDGIHDLVHLILQNLQFCGESVAIDEVDIDSVIIKVIDALKDYYNATTETQDVCRHTILILDNQLHGFPWESLPCLRSQSVSRLPSLADLRDRILAAKSSSSAEQQQGLVISRTSGSSLLNPSGDLTKTAQRFQPWLNKLPANWAHLRNAPDDEGWRDMLSENELFLYVGHGSTSQYVRPRVVKRLGYQESTNDRQSCAVSWLIGCGSVAIEDLGEFEPSGMVLSYLAAGSPAVLGALWDVGDIDADHFSITAGDYWGLWDESNKGLDPKLLPARKKIAEERKAMGRSLSMCEAVARSRGGCKLPYLNGAAFVVYGIPVFLG